MDFLVCKDGTPWMIVEAKCSDKSMSKNVEHFQAQAKATHAFQVVNAMKYVDRDCFEYDNPMVVLAKTLLSQLV